MAGTDPHPGDSHTPAERPGLRVIGIGGVPASGKSTLMRRVIRRLGMGLPTCARVLLPSGKGRCPLPYTAFRCGKLLVMGSYEPGEPYPGTDRLSMAAPAALPVFLERCEKHAREGIGSTWLLYEGQRFFSASLVERIARSYPGSRFIVLEAPEAIRSARMAGRGDTKGERFLKACQTQVANAAKAALDAGAEVSRLRHESHSDLEGATELILGWLGS